MQINYFEASILNFIDAEYNLVSRKKIKREGV
jgi:hypothetical protein